LLIFYFDSVSGKTKQRFIDTWERIPQGIINKATNQTRLSACVKAKGHHFLNNTYCDHVT